MRNVDPASIQIATSADAIASLLAQLSSSEPRFTRAELEATVADPGTKILAVGAGGGIVGITPLVTFRVVTGVRAFIDDVVVWGAHRSKGLAEKLVRAAIELAASLGVQKIHLTSQPSREAANSSTNGSGSSGEKPTCIGSSFQRKRPDDDGEDHGQRLCFRPSGPLQ
ncbi:GNAT family N-acetyltransferase [Fulvimarina sp. MAC8]|uniref:GNAT family N-acetyltransferase n=1 Tax=Fulvimarina sp. MAC8 TaxID=3162874 RepID=UPI0032EF1F7C